MCIRDRDEDWAQYLVDNDLTHKKYRKQLIDSYTQQILLQQAQKENGVTVLDTYVLRDVYKRQG